MSVAEDIHKRTLDNMSGPFLGKVLALIMYGLVAIVLFDGWLHRGDGSITAESGIGYAMGIIGGSMMLVMLLYSLRKRVDFMRKLGNIRYWFRMHMLFGVLGPSLILYHSNFQLGSLNSTVALFCMLLVAGSGLVGRYFYTQIHYGLYGQKISLAKLRDEESVILQQLAEVYPHSDELIEQLKLLDTKYIRAGSGLLVATFQRMTIRLRLFFTYRSLREATKINLRNHAQEDKLTDNELIEKYRVVKTYIDDYLFRIRKISSVAFYERLFALWHVVHVPFFIMLVLSGITHVIAVHLY